MPGYKLAFIIERFFKFGGLQRDMHKMALACTQAGHDVTVFTNKWDDIEKPAFGVELLNIRASTNHGTIRKIERFVCSLRQKRQYDCIVGFNRMAGLDVYFGGDPCLKAMLKSKGLSFLCLLPRYRTYLKLEEGVFGHDSNTDVMIISPVEQQVIKKVYKIEPGRIHLLPPGIDAGRLEKYSMSIQQRKEFRRQYNIEGDGFLIVTVGSSFMTKGVDRAIYAIASLPQEIKSCCHYVVIGQGDIKKFQVIADKAGIGKNVTFTGGREDVGAFYYAGDLLLHPARTETAGHILLESLCCGLPVIVTENCGYARYIKDADGGVICPDPYRQYRLNKILQDLLTDKDARLRFGRNGHNYTRTADIYSMIQRAVEIIISRAGRNRTAK
jgi:UDP-glucose:(heptosyl)LPS alpha-1,3-glucosyltransferase